MNNTKVKILIIQTAFIGDVILATAILEKLHKHFPDAVLDILIKKGNESLFQNHPYLNKIWVLEKSKNKFTCTAKLILEIRKQSFDKVINLHRFFSSGLITVLSNAKMTFGFDKNPLSFFFSKTVPHQISEKKNSVHEIQRNQNLISIFTDNIPEKPVLYPSESDFQVLANHKLLKPYVCISPASVWFTKQWPSEKWIQLIQKLDSEITIFLLGSGNDLQLCNDIAEKSGSKKVRVLAGKLSLLQSAALVKTAEMNYVNDSGPLHLCSAVNAPVTAIFCSTVPEFGFGPLSDHSHIAQTDHVLKCRPCSLHGRKSCPEGHFKCAEIEIDKIHIVKSKV
ncbi:MAG: glycosyltransferase family 9 protein [Saprospiraceae bacterium]|nr:glycosyltransferase family 9 protein [Saprospiraceae bacterium]